MAAPKVEAQEIAFRTPGPSTDSELPSSRKFLFENMAASSTKCWAVAVEHLLKGDQPNHPDRMASAKMVCDVQPHLLRSGGLPADAQTRATSKLPVKSKGVDEFRHLHPGGSEPVITKVTKPSQGNGQVKAAGTASRRNIKKGYKPPTKQKPEEELKDQNQLLEAVNQRLHQKLAETQRELKDLAQKVELLEKSQGNCLAILESNSLYPGSKTLASQPKPTTDHADAMLLLQTLRDELKVFNETAEEQMEELEALKVKVKLKEEERMQFLKQQTLCKDQASDFTIVLEEMEQLLEM